MLNLIIELVVAVTRRINLELVQAVDHLPAVEEGRQNGWGEGVAREEGYRFGVAVAVQVGFEVVRAGFVGLLVGLHVVDVVEVQDA